MDNFLIKRKIRELVEQYSNYDDSPNDILSSEDPELMELLQAMQPTFYKMMDAEDSEYDSTGQGKYS